jgi:hypothetical protein
MKINYLTKNIIFGIVVLIFIAVWGFAFSFLTKYLDRWLALALPLLVYFIALLFIKRTNNFISGFIGERDIDEELKSLGTDFICINDGLDTGHGNIDKIVIGPTGVWALEVKSHKVHVTFDGNVLLNWGKPFVEGDFLKQAYAEAKTLQDMLKSKLDLDINVQPVVVFSNKLAKVRFGLDKQKGVYVIQRAWLKKLLTETHVQSLDSVTLLKIKEILKVS